MTHTHTQTDTMRTVDWNSLVLLLLLTVPTGCMAVVLFLWPDIRWVAEVPGTAIGILGAVTEALLAVFIIARYRDNPGINLVSAGLVAMAIVNGIQSVSSPETSEFVWLHSLAGIFGSLFFTLFVLARSGYARLHAFTIPGSYTGRLLAASGGLAAVVSIVILSLPGSLPSLVIDGRFTGIAWLINSIPIALFLFSGISLFRLYRRTGSRKLFLLTAIVIFLFQASEVFYLASLWSVIWWSWLILRFIIYMYVLSYVLREYIQTGNSLAVEIEERKQVEHALRTSEENWRNSFNSLEDVMISIDSEYRIENINASGLELLGKEIGDVLGEKCVRIVRGLDEPARYGPLQRTLTTGTTEHLEWYDETCGKHFAVKSFPVFSENGGSITKCVYLMEDISEQVEAKDKEALLQRELNLTSRLASIGEVAAGITHEINNPLTSVIAFAQLLAQQELSGDVQESVGVINESAGRIATIVDKLLTFARQRKPDKEYMDVNEVIRSIAEMRSYEMRNNNVELVTDLDPDLPLTMANIGELQQVFLNIIINAEQAIASGEQRAGQICIGTAGTDTEIQVTIRDDGPGIAEEYLEKLFDPFFTTKESNGGTGLGLSISYGIIREHAGKISTISTPGNGATFIIELPVVPDTDSPQEVSRQPEEPEKVTGGNILVVDDELYICRALEKILTVEGHRVETISDAEKALQRLDSSCYDLILLDIRMPGIDGIEFYQRMKKINPSLQDKVICITGDIISPKNRAFLEKSRIPCVTKPFGIDELVRLVKEVLGGNMNNEEMAYTYS